MPGPGWLAGRSRTRAPGPHRWPSRLSVGLGSEGRLDPEAPASAGTDGGAIQLPTRTPPRRARRQMGGAGASEAPAGVRRVASRRRLPRRPAGARGVPPGVARGASGPGAPVGAAQRAEPAPRGGPSAMQPPSAKEAGSPSAPGRAQAEREVFSRGPPRAREPRSPRRPCRPSRRGPPSASPGSSARRVPPRPPLLWMGSLAGGCSEASSAGRWRPRGCPWGEPSQPMRAPAPADSGVRSGFASKPFAWPSRRRERGWTAFSVHEVRDGRAGRQEQ